MFKPFTLLLLCLLGKTTVLWSQNVQLNDENYKRIPPRVTQVSSHHGAKSIPRSVSLKMYAPLAGDQKDLSTDLAWAIAYALTIQEARQLALTDKAAIQRLFYSPAFIYYHIKDKEDVNCKNGVDILKAMNAIQEFGVVRHSDLPFDCPDSISTDLMNKAFKNVVPAFTPLIEPNEVKNGNVKKALSEGNPVIIIQQEEGQTVGHAMCVVGYKDDFTIPNGGYFEILNSRGREWQSEGYAKISYEMFKKVVVYAMEVPNLLALPNTEVDSMQVVQSFKSKVRLMDIDSHKIELRGVSGFVPQGHRVSRVPNMKVSHFFAKNPVSEGLGYQVLLDNETASYVYIFYFDSHKQVDLLFPYDDSVSAHMGKQTTFTLPSEDMAFYFDKGKGSNYNCILFSHKPLDIKNLKIKIETEAAKLDSIGRFPSFAQCLENVLGEQLASTGKDSIRYDVTERILNLNMKTDKNIVAIIIEFEHK